MARGPGFADSICSDAVCGPSPRWSCLAQVPVAATDPGPFHAALTLVDLVTRQPVAGALATLCDKIDVTCSSPRQELVSDAGGQVTFQVERGFSGYVALEKASMKSSLYFLNPPVDRDVEITQTMASLAASNGLAGQFGTALLADRGSVVITAQDCEGNPGRDVAYSTTGGDASTAVFYVLGGLPTTNSQATDGTGAGGLINVPVGNIAISALVAGHNVPMSQVSVVVRGNVTTYTRMVPIGR